MTNVTHAIFRSLYKPPENIEIKVPYSFMGSPYGDEELQAVKRVIDSGWLTTGLETVLFEKEWGSYHKVDYSYTSSSCTTALHMAAQLCKLKPGDEVITTPLTFISTSQAVLALGAVPIFVDVDPQTWNLDPRKIEEKITSKTKAIFVTHLTGQMADMDSIIAIARQYHLFVVEDCAHVQGGMYKGKYAGTFGDIGCFSFHSIKNMTTLGEGGMLTTNRDDWATKIPWLRSMGSRYPEDPHDDGTPGPREYDVDNVNDFVPSNSRMTEAQSAVGREQLKKLPRFLARRQALAKMYSDELNGFGPLTTPYTSPDVFHTYHQFGMQVQFSSKMNNKILHEKLLYEKGVHTVPGMYRPSYLFKLYQKRGLKPGICPIAEKISDVVLQLPLYPQMTDQNVQYTIESIKDLVR